MGVILKPGVRMTAMSPQTALAINVAHGVWVEYGDPDMVITSINDGTHSHTSLHYSGNAFDIRVRDPQSGEIVSAPDDRAKKIKERLGNDFDVLYELSPPHIHVEYQPRKT